MQSDLELVEELLRRPMSVAQHAALGRVLERLRSLSETPEIPEDAIETVARKIRVAIDARVGLHDGVEEQCRRAIAALREFDARLPSVERLSAVLFGYYGVVPDRDSYEAAVVVRGFFRQSTPVR
jgi:hypothetical protein